MDDPQGLDQLELGPATVTPVAPAAPGAATPAWGGDFRPFWVGDPGRAANARSYPDHDNWDYRDTVLDGVALLGGEDTPPMVLRAASTRGRSHRYSGKVRQDAYAFRCDGRFVVAGVADGVSSGPLSHVAANIVSQHGCHMIINQLGTTPPESLDWADLLLVLSKKVLSAGHRRLAPALPAGAELTSEEIAGQLSTTALFAVVDMRPEYGLHPVHIFSYGDTSAWILRSGSRWEPQQPVKNADALVASSATDALPYYPEQPLPVVRAELGRQDVLVLISDGIGDPLGDGTGSVGAFLAEKWRHPPEPLEFAAHVDFARRSHDDDRTAVAVWPT